MRKIYFSDFQTLIWPKYPNFLCYITLKPVQKKLIFQVLQKTKSWSAHNFQKRTEPKFQKKYHFFVDTGASQFTICALCNEPMTSLSKQSLWTGWVFPKAPNCFFFQRNIENLSISSLSLSFIISPSQFSCSQFQTVQKYL